MGTGHPDPQRRDRILAAALDVVAEVGVAGASHRRVAARAGVPLGSMTYHFSGLDDVLHQAFARFAEEGAAAFEARLARARSRQAVLEAIVDNLMEDLAGPRNRVLTMELYTLATRDPAFRDLTTAWTRRTREALTAWFPPQTARDLDALLEGMSIHRALGDAPSDRASALATMNRLAE